MKQDKKYWTMFNYVEFELPHDAVIDCYHPGPCDDDVAHWQPILNLNLDREKMILELSEYGAWSDEELNSSSNEELEERLIWLGAGNIIEDNEEFHKGE